MVSLWREVTLAILSFASAYALWYVRDRKKSRAETAVAEGSVGSDVALRKIGTDSATIAFVNEAFRMERESKDREISSLKVKIAEQEQEISELRKEVARLTARLNRLDPQEEVR